MDYVSVKFKREKNIGAVIFIPGDVVTLPRGIADSMSDFLDITGPAEASSSMTLVPRSLVSGYGNAPTTLGASNAAAVNGATLSLAAGGTLTVDGGAWAALSAGLVILVGQGGTATLAFSGSAVKENSSGTSATSVSLAAAGVYALTPSPTGSPVFRLSGGAAL